MASSDELPTPWERFYPVLQQVTFVAAVVFAASTGPGLLALGAIAGQLVALKRLVAARHERQDIADRLTLIEEEVQRVAEREPKIQETLDWLRLGQIRLDEHAQGLAAEVADLEERIKGVHVEVTARDARHAVQAYAEALAADEEESARAYARVAARAIAGRTRDQLSASAIVALGNLTADGLQSLRVHGGWRPAGALRMKSGGSHWNIDDLHALAGLGLVEHNVPPGAPRPSGSHRVGLTQLAVRVLELTNP